MAIRKEYITVMWFIHKLLIDKWAAGIAHTLLLNLCMSKKEVIYFDHFNSGILNFNCFMPHFAFSMQCVFWTVLLIIYLQITHDPCGFMLYHYFLLHSLAASWCCLFNYAIGLSTQGIHSLLHDMLPSWILLHCVSYLNVLVRLVSHFLHGTDTCSTLTCSVCLKTWRICAKLWWLITCICSILQKSRGARIVMSQPPEEERAHGRITMKTYYKYFTTERGHLFTLLMVVTFILAEVREHTCSLVLCTWIMDQSCAYLLPCVQYAVSCIFITLCAVCGYAVVAFFCVPVTKTVFLYTSVNYLHKKWITGA